MWSATFVDLEMEANGDNAAVASNQFCCKSWEEARSHELTM